jgi:hypothetical protein
MPTLTDPHLSLVRPVTPRTPAGCEECLILGSGWVHLRLCLTCGHVGCCDSSPLRPGLRLLRRPDREGGLGRGARDAGGARHRRPGPRPVPRRAQPADRRGRLVFRGGPRRGRGARGAGRPAPGAGGPRSHVRRPDPARLPAAPLDPDRARGRPADRRLEVLPGHPAGPGLRGQEPASVPVPGPPGRPVRRGPAGPVRRWPSSA